MREEDERWDEVVVRDEERYEDEYEALEAVTDAVDYTTIRGDNLALGAVTAFQRRGDAARRRSAFIAEGTGAYFAFAELVALQMPSPAREIMLNYLFGLGDHISAEEGRALIAMLSGYGGNLTMHAPHLPHAPEQPEEGGVY